jgi:hypothetical protein
LLRELVRTVLSKPPPSVGLIESAFTRVQCFEQLPERQRLPSGRSMSFSVHATAIESQQSCRRSGCDFQPQFAKHTRKRCKAARCQACESARQVDRPDRDLLVTTDHRGITFGAAASTVFTLFAVPASYWLLNQDYS